jgi:hypothetical protein
VVVVSPVECSIIEQAGTQGGIGSIAGGPRLLPVEERKREHIQDTHSTRGRAFVCGDHSFFFLPSGFSSSARRSPICAIHFRSRLPWFALVSRVVSGLFLECGLKLIQAGT